MRYGCTRTQIGSGYQHLNVCINPFYLVKWYSDGLDKTLRQGDGRGVRRPKTDLDISSSGDLK